MCVVVGMYVSKICIHLCVYACRCVHVHVHVRACVCVWLLLKCMRMCGCCWTASYHSACAPIKHLQTLVHSCPNRFTVLIRLHFGCRSLKPVSDEVIAGNHKARKEIPFWVISRSAAIHI
ncbi:hypothetical protein KP509_03G038300 [Ceratopteris richardii]|uniref:Uncharacterized protein n=1 Tax=Ceratopteris richardii TaxID=49495 RepID=A0A8T2V5W4_CERRI|nr:hypothetical protein KP509_03G038300 [Ceratopteris richardii]